MPEPATTTSPEEPSRRSSPPNYAARRMLVSTIGIMAIVAFGVFGWTVVRGGDDGAGSSGTGGDWNEIALVDRATGAITVVDADGELTSELVGRGRVREIHGIGNRLALVGPMQIVIEGDGESTTIPIERSDTVTAIRTVDTLHLVIGDANGGNVVLVDLESGEMLDIAELGGRAEPQIFAEPRMYAETLRWSADGQRFAVADASSFQTVVVRQGSDDVAFFGSQPVALDDELIATSQTIGGQADISLLDQDRNSKARVPTPIAAGGVMVDGGLLMVAIDGGVHRVEPGSTEAEELGRIALPAGATVDSVHPTLDGDRLVVAGPVFEAVIDLDARTLFTTTFAAPIEVTPPGPDARCVAIGGDTTFHSLVDLDSGDQLADLSGLEVTGSSADGCTVIGVRAGITEVVDAEGAVPIGRVRAAALAPDGRTVVRTSTAGVTEIVPIEDRRLGDPVPLADVPANPAVAFLG